MSGADGALQESTLPCAVVQGRDAAERAVAALAAAGVAATVAAPGARFHNLPAGSLEIRVAAGQAARARVILGLGS
jgi:hypothetical protein